MLFTNQAVAVAGEGVEVKVVDEPVQPNGDLRGPREVARVDRGVEGKRLPRQAHPVGQTGSR